MTTRSFWTSSAAVLVSVGIGISSLVACSDEATSVSPPSPPPPDTGTDAGKDTGAPPTPPLELRATPWGETSHASIVRMFPAGDGFVVLEEWTELEAHGWSHPRRVRWLRADGTEVARYEAASSEQLIDAAVHPSGDVSVLVVSHPSGWAVRRVRSDGTAPIEGKIEPREALMETYVQDSIGMKIKGPFNAYTYDVARVVAHGEDAVAAIRTGRNTVGSVELRFAGGAWSSGLQSLLVRGVGMIGVGLQTGSFDVYGLLDAQFQVFGDMGPGGRALFAVDARSDVVAAFNMDHVGWLNPVRKDGRAGDVLVTRPENFQEPDRTPGFVVGTTNNDEPTALRVIGDSAYVLGRTGHPGDNGFGHDALVAKANATTMEPTWARAIDLDRGDIFFDIAQASGERLVAVGSCGYWRNPQGMSISEEADACGAVLDAEGQLVNRITFPKGLRQNQARAILPLGKDRFLVAGMTDGPGTHSADELRGLAASKGAFWLLEPAAR